MRTERIGFHHNASVGGLNAVFIGKILFHIRQEYFPHRRVCELFHGIFTAVPAVEIADN